MEKPKNVQAPVVPDAPAKNHHSQNIFTMASHNASLLKQQVAQQMAAMAGMGISMLPRAMRCVSKYQPHQGAKERARRLKQAGK